MDKRDELRLGFETAYINSSVTSNSFYSPQFVSNNYKDGRKYYLLLKMNFKMR